MAIKSDVVRGSQPAEERSHAFLLRCWQEPGSTSEGESAWRFSLTLIDKRHKPKGFTDLEAMLAYVRQILMENQNVPSEGEPS